VVCDRGRQRGRAPATRGRPGQPRPRHARPSGRGSSCRAATRSAASPSHEPIMCGTPTPWSSTSCTGRCTHRTEREPGAGGLGAAGRRAARPGAQRAAMKGFLAGRRRARPTGSSCTWLPSSCGRWRWKRERADRARLLAAVGHGTHGAAGSVADPPARAARGLQANGGRNLPQPASGRPRDCAAAWPCVVSEKIDGETWFLHRNGDGATLLSPTGKALTGVPLTDEAGTLLPGWSGLLAESCTPRGTRATAGLRPSRGHGRRCRGPGGAAALRGLRLLLDGDADTQRSPYAARVTRLQSLLQGGTRSTAPPARRWASRPAWRPCSSGSSPTEGQRASSSTPATAGRTR